jgi:hypothetical protein
MAKKALGRTASGVAITDELIDKLAAKAEAGYDNEETLRRRGARPAMGSAAASVESVRLEPELREALDQRGRARSRDDVLRDSQGAASIPEDRLAPSPNAYLDYRVSRAGFDGDRVVSFSVS